MRRSLLLCKKRKTDVVPLDLLIEILNRLPAKSVARFMLVSKSWEQIIRSKYFIRSFPSLSLTQPCRLLIVLPNKDAAMRRSFSFFSSSSWDSSSTSTSMSFLSRITLPSKNDDYPTDQHYYYVNGLMNLGRIICNPTTGKSITLPRLFKTRKSITSPSVDKTDPLSRQVRLLRRQSIRFFGYDPVNNQYKVLSMSPNQRYDTPWSDIRVFTLGTKPKSWRAINCSIPHSPRSNGVCIDGCVYYIAYTDKIWTQLSLMRFDLKSEKFDVFAKVSEDLKALCCFTRPLTLVNYHGKVAIAIQPDLSFHLIDLFVFEAGKQDFKEMSFHNTPELHVRMKGVINHTGEIIFAPSYLSREEAKLFCYDPKGASLKKMKIEVDANQELTCYRAAYFFVDYVESLMLL